MKSFCLITKILITLVIVLCYLNNTTNHSYAYESSLLAKKKNSRSPKGSKGSKKSKSPKESERSKIPLCKSKSPLFSVSPVATSDIDHIIPLGNVSPPFHIFPVRHLYFHINRIEDNSRIAEEVSVFSPGDMWVTSIESMSYLDTNDEVEREDFLLNFSPCKEVKGYFIHLTSISNKLKKAFAGGDKTCGRAQAGSWTWISCSKGTRIKLKAGETIGTAGGDYTTALDFGLSDFRTEEITFTNPKRQLKKDGFFTVCPLDYYPLNVKEELETYLGNGEIQRTTSPLCGSVREDIPGTAQGNWYVQGTKIQFIANEDPQLALVHDNIDPTKEVFSIGTSLEPFGAPAGAYEFTPNESGLVNRDFKDITSDGNLYCFETKSRNSNQGSSDFSFLVRLTDSKTLEIRKNDSGTCEAIAEELVSSFVTFER